MSEMMRGMMAGVVPSGVSPENLPDPRSRGAALLASYCTQCHALPSPRMHAAAEWPAVAARMTERMRMMARMGGMMMGAVRAPGPQEESALLQYLQEHAMRAAPSGIVESDAPGGRAFARLCSQCHAPPDPAQHTPAEWPPIVERMQQNHRQMGRPLMTDAETRSIAGFLRENAVTTRRR